ncbi:autophagy protein 13, partial [Linderina pennispora]
ARQRRASTIVLEVWRLDLATNQLPNPIPDLPRVYKQAIIFFRSLYAFASLLPAVSLIQRLHAAQELGDLDVFCTLRPDLSPRDGVIDLDVSFTGTERFLESYRFEPVGTPMGSFLMSVQYRRECGFMYNPATYEQQHGDISGIAAIDDTYFTPTLSSRNNSNFSLPRLAHHQPSPQQQHQPQHQPQHHSVARRATLTTIPSHGRQTPAKYSPPVRPQHTPSASHSAASQLAAGHRSLMAPSVNPFRARPLSLGDSSSLPSYLGDSSAPRVPSRLSAESHRQNDTYPRRAAGRDI